MADISTHLAMGLSSLKWLSIKQLEELKEQVVERLEVLEREEFLKKEDAVHDAAIAEWFRLAKELLPSYGQLHKHNTKCLRTALIKAYNNLDEKHKWRSDVIETDHRNTPCDSDDCWYRRHIDRFDGVTEVQISIFVDVNLGDTMTLCDVCCDNDEKHDFEVDSEMYVCDFVAWLKRK